VNKRGVLLDAAYLTHPERFVNHAPQPPQLPTNSWINPPNQTRADVQ
jgi:putative transposase